LLHMQQKFVVSASGNGWAATALRLADGEGLKARKIIALGKASLRATPWVNRPQNFQALKGRKNPPVWLARSFEISLQAISQFLCRPVRQL
jgi:hypothetical protein